MYCKARKYKLGYSEINSVAGSINWDIPDLDVLPHRNESTSFFWFFYFVVLVYLFLFSYLRSADNKTKQNKKKAVWK